MFGGTRGRTARGFHFCVHVARHLAGPAVNHDEKRRRTDGWRHYERDRALERPRRGGPAYASSSSGCEETALSSIAMSLNSLESKTSPHSLHSTYSASSSRDTICTRRCLHMI